MKQGIRSVLKAMLLIAVYVVLFAAGSALMLPADMVGDAPGPEGADALLPLLAIGAIDVAVIVGIVLSSRLRGWRLWALTTAVVYGAKTFTSQLEAAYFMKNVTTQMLPGLFLMTLPALVVVPLLAVLLYNRWRGPEESPAWRIPVMSAGEWAVKLTVLSAVVYPALFFSFGYFVAFRSEAVLAFYGVTELQPFFGHLSQSFGDDPLLLPFEALRGALWVGFAVALIWTTRGGGWLGGVWAMLVFSLVQNDVHLLSNPLMPTEVRHYHFIETASSNAINALLITWAMRRSHRPAAVEVATG